MHKQTIDPKDIEPRYFYRILTGAVAPRPIALVSSVNEAGEFNLSPFSFFNVFGPNPPIMIFSPVTRMRDGSTKDTLNNVREVGEVTINICDMSMTQQIALAGHEYSSEVNEFEKTGLTPEKAIRVRPPFVLESPVSFECKVKQIIETGTEGGAGNLVVCEVILAHVKDDYVNSDYHIDPFKMSYLARLGGSYYAGITDANIFEVNKEIKEVGIGADCLPKVVWETEILTGNDIGMLATQPKIPTEQEVMALLYESDMRDVLPQMDKELFMRLVKSELELGNAQKALLVLFAYDYQG